MPAPQSVIQAALTRLSARLGSGLLDAAAQTAVVLQDAPERLRQEFSLFWQEVELEAERLERDAAAAGADGDRADSAAGAPPRPPRDLQAQIDGLRAQVATFSRRLDQTP
jgi:hypothetical protein